MEMTFCRTPGRGSFTRAWVWGLTSALVSTQAAPAFGAEPSPTELSVARHLFTEAVELERAERWQLAALKLRDAIVIKDTPGLRFHLGHCEDKQGHLVEAMLSYDRAHELIAAGAKAADVEEVLEPTRAALERRMPYLVLVTPVELPQIKVDVDGVTLARSVLGRPAPVNPGVHHIVAHAEGYRDFIQDLPIEEGERRTVHIDLEPSRAAVASSSPPRKAGLANEAQPPSSTRTVVLVAESAFTVAALGVGGVFLLIRSSHADRIEEAQRTADRLSTAPDSCSTDTSVAVRVNCKDLNDAISAYNTSTKIAVGGFIGAGVGAVATALTLVLWPSAPFTPQVDHSAKQSVFGVSGRF
jgi:hypothetical protein